jgi:hypothetical protein
MSIFPIIIFIEIFIYIVFLANMSIFRITVHIVEKKIDFCKIKICRFTIDFTTNSKFKN